MVDQHPLKVKVEGSSPSSASPRQFQPSDLHTITTAEYNAMSEDDQRAYNRFVLDQWSRTDDAFLDGDYDRVGSYRRYELGE